MDYYLAWIQILDPHTMFEMGSHDAAVSCDSWCDSVCPLPGVKLQHSNWQKLCSPPHTHTPITGPPPCFTVDMIQGVAAFTNSLPHTDPPIWLKNFKFWFVSPKNFIPLPWPAGAFWHCFAFSTLVSWQQFCHS